MQTAPPTITDIPKKETDLLRSLAVRAAELAAADENDHKAQLWSRLTDLDTTVRPLLLTHLWPLAWSQVLADETTLVCQHETARRYERDLRERIWLSENLADDGVIEPVMRYPHCVSIEPYGGLAAKRVYARDDHAHTGAGIFLAKVIEKADIEKLGAPRVSVDYEKRNGYRLEAEDIFGGILEVIPEGIYFAAKVVDEWVELRGMQQVYFDMLEDPE